MRQKAKFISVTDVRNVNFRSREGEEKKLVSISYQIQWLIFSEQGKSYTQDLIVESIVTPEQAANIAPGPINDDRWFDMQINFQVNRSKDGRYFNSIRLTRFAESPYELP